MQSKIIIFVALMAVAWASEEVSDDKKTDGKSLDAVETKKDKRGLWDLGYGINTYGGLTSYSTYSEPAPAYSVYPASTHTVITKEVAVPVEKHFYPVRHITYPATAVKVAVPVVQHTYSLPAPSYASPIVIQKNSGWAPSYSSW